VGSNSERKGADERGLNRQDTEVAELDVDEPAAGLNRLTHRVIGAAIDVHRSLGPGLLESVYEEALCVELTWLGIPFARQVSLHVDYRRHRVGEAKLDLLVDQRLIIELKAVDRIAPIHLAQLLSYLKITKLRLGLLINFNVTELRSGIKRCINGV
jgi:GxxExxY protein